MNDLDKGVRHDLIQNMIDIHNWHHQQVKVKAANKKKALHQKYAGQLYKAIQVLKQTMEE